MAALAPVVVPYNYNEMSIQQRLVAPGGSHLLGTDNLGRDVFSLLLFGSRPYVEISLLATGAALVLGLILGFIAARVKGKTGTVLGAVVLVPVFSSPSLCSSSKS